jgi:hypothetical protein
MLKISLFSVGVLGGALFLRAAAPHLLRTVSVLLRETVSRVVSSGRIELCSVQKIRKEFREVPCIVGHTSQKHSHPELARNRFQASLMIRSLAATTGYGIFSHQSANRDRCPGRRDYYWMKDTQVPAVAAEPTDRDLVMIVDTDYYMNMPQYLLEHDNIVVLYTVQPTRAADHCDGMSFWFTKDNQFVMKISGGAEYSHDLWNYGVDVITVRSMWGWVTKSYVVERRQLSQHHCLVALIPIGKWIGISSYVTLLLESVSLTRLKPVVGSWSVLNVMDATRNVVSVAECGKPMSADVPIEVDVGLRSIVKVSKQQLTVSVVESHVTRHGLSREQAALLCAYYRETLSDPQCSVYPIQYAVSRFQYVSSVKDIDLDARPSLEAYMSPIYNGAYTPDVTAANEKRCVTERIERLKQPDKEVTPDFIEFVMEFAGKLFPEVGVLVPVDEDEVWLRQARPSQQRTLEEGCVMGDPKRVVKAFQKKEAYVKITDPRNISTINPKDKLMYSRMIYALAEHLKSCPWYAFGQPPAAIAQRVALICCYANFVVPSDYHRLDGTINNLCRYLEHVLMMRGFAPSYHDEISNLMRSQHHQKGVGSFGTWYETGFSRLSGSPETAAFNTIVTAFVAFIGYRLSGMEPDDAYRRLGIYGGDDGLSADLEESKFIHAAGLVGLRLDYNRLERGQPGVNFLARFYTRDVWFGDETSCCDIKRQLAKFHTTVPKGELKPEVKLVEKSYSYYLSDRNTPIIGCFVEKVIELANAQGYKLDPREDKYGLRSYSSLCDAQDQYVNVFHPDFMDHAIRVIPGYNPEIWLEWVASRTQLSEMLCPPMLSCDESPVPPNVLVNLEGLLQFGDFAPEPCGPIPDQPGFDKSIVNVAKTTTTIAKPSTAGKPAKVRKTRRQKKKKAAAKSGRTVA